MSLDSEVDAARGKEHGAGGTGAAGAGGTGAADEARAVDVAVDLPSDPGLAERFPELGAPTFRLNRGLAARGFGAVLVLSKEEAMWVQDALRARRRAPRLHRGSTIQLRRRIMAALYRNSAASLRELGEVRRERVVREALNLEIDGATFWDEQLNPLLRSDEDYSLDLERVVCECVRRTAPRLGPAHPPRADTARASARTRRSPKSGRRGSADGARRRPCGRRSRSPPRAASRRSRSASVSPPTAARSWGSAHGVWKVRAALRRAAPRCSDPAQTMKTTATTHRATTWAMIATSTASRRARSACSSRAPCRPRAAATGGAGTTTWGRRRLRRCENV